MEPEEKEFTNIMPPAYHFKRAVMFKVAAQALKKIGMYYDAQKFEVNGVYEVALGLQALVYQSSVPPA